jgi:hypothetical protein
MLVELMFFDFLCKLNTANHHGSRLESFEPEYRPDPSEVFQAVVEVQSAETIVAQDEALRALAI